MDGSSRRSWLAIAVIATATFAPGCARPFLVRALGHRFSPPREHLRGLSLSASTSALLGSLGLDGFAQHHPHDVFFLLEQGTDRRLRILVVCSLWQSWPILSLEGRRCAHPRRFCGRVMRRSTPSSA